jgi:hypothetical protein
MSQNTIVEVKMPNVLKVKQLFMIGFYEMFGNDFSDENVFAYNESTKKKNKKPKNSPPKVSEKLSQELYNKIVKKDRTPEIVFAKLRKYTGDEMAKALEDISIDPSTIVENAKVYCRHKDVLLTELIKVYSNNNTPSTSPHPTPQQNDETKEDEDEDEDEEVWKDTKEEIDEDYENRINELRKEYKTKSLKDIKALCRERSIEIDKTATKDDMIEELVEYDMNE